MITVLSPAKSLNFDKQDLIDKSTDINFPKKTNELVKVLKNFSAKEIGDLMSISANLSDLNFERYQEFSKKYTSENAKQAILAFTGDVYKGLEAEKFDKKDFDFAQDHVRILSGLYGVIKPLDLIQPYRLEMGTKLEVSEDAKNLYEFWSETNTKLLNKELNGEMLINLASNEYFKSVNVKDLKSDVLNVDFKENKNGKYKIIAFYAKVARGYMTNYIVKNKINKPEDLRGFDYDGYSFNESLSKENNFVFTRG